MKLLQNLAPLSLLSVHKFVTKRYNVFSASPRLSSLTSYVVIRLQYGLQCRNRCASQHQWLFISKKNYRLLQPQWLQHESHSTQLGAIYKL